MAYATVSDVADGRIDRRVYDLERARLEPRILEAMKNRPAPQALRWAAFEARLAPDMRDYIGWTIFLEFDERFRKRGAVTIESLLQLRLRMNG